MERDGTGEHSNDKYLEDEDWFDGSNVEGYTEYPGVIPDYKAGRYEGHLAMNEDHALSSSLGATSSSETKPWKEPTYNFEGDKGRYDEDEDWATDYSAYSGSRDAGTVVGFDKSTGETVEFETFDPIIFDEVLEHKEQVAEAEVAAYVDSITTHVEALSEQPTTTFDSTQAHHSFGDTIAKHFEETKKQPTAASTQFEETKVEEAP